VATVNTTKHRHGDPEVAAVVGVVGGKVHQLSVSEASSADHGQIYRRDAVARV